VKRTMDVTFHAFDGMRELAERILVIKPIPKDGLNVR